MALINCPECGRLISDQAMSCPNCGMPLNSVSDDNPIIDIEDEDINDSFEGTDVDYLVCPNCGSRKLHIEKKGFSVGKAAAGAIAFGGVGILAGAIGNNKIKAICLECGKTVTPVKESEKIKKDQELFSAMVQPLWVSLLLILFYSAAIILLFIAIYMFVSEDFLWGIILFGIGFIITFPAKKLEAKYSNKK